MSALFFEPWIGARYAETRDWRLRLLAGQLEGEQGDGFPVHVKGESHYGESHENTPTNTARIMGECAFAPSHCSQFFTKLANLFADASGLDFGSGFRRAIWDRLAFSNFVQEVLPSHSVPPHKAQIANAQEAFFEQLRLTAPTVLLVVSYRLWQSLPDCNCTQTGHVPSFGPTAAPIPESRVYTYHVGNQHIWTHAICVPHPRTSAFRRKECAAKLLNALLVQSEIQRRFCSFDQNGELSAPIRFDQQI
jgi:hypothetical protein